MTVKEMKIGECAMVKGYKKSSGSYLQKILAMGLTRGSIIKMIKIAPMGDPVEFEVRGFNLSLRKDEAELLILEGVENE